MEISCRPLVVRGTLIGGTQSLSLLKIFDQEPHARNGGMYNLKDNKYNRYRSMKSICTYTHCRANKYKINIIFVFQLGLTIAVCLKVYRDYNKLLLL